MERAKSDVRRTLDEVKGFLAQESPPKLTEADTKANFIEPIVAALGWTGIGSVTREYYVKNSQEFIDYVMRGPSTLLLAVEAKALQADLTDKAAAQLIQYCAVEGIEWAALTNGRELQFFNTFLKPNLAAKRILSLDLLAFNNDEEFDALFLQLWQLSRQSMTTPTGVRSWLNQRRMDATLRGILFDPSSPATRQLRKALQQAEITATPQDIVQWFRGHLGTPITVLARPEASGGHRAKPPTPHQLVHLDSPAESTAPDNFDPSSTHVLSGAGEQLVPLFEALREAVTARVPSTAWRSLKWYVAAEAEGKTYLAVKRRGGALLVGLTLPPSASAPTLQNNATAFNWSRITKVARLSSASDITDELLSFVELAASHARHATSRKQHHGITIRDLITAGLIHAGETAVLAKATEDLASATITGMGTILWQGQEYPSPSDRAFAALMGRQSLNGWTSWFLERPDGRKSLADLRTQLQQGDAVSEPRETAT